MPGYAHQAGDVQPALNVGRYPRKGQGEISGAEQSAPEVCVIPGQTRKASPKSGTHIYYPYNNGHIACGGLGEGEALPY
eukprot:5678049-Prymnesium_polylepis.1